MKYNFNDFSDAVTKIGNEHKHLFNNNCYFSNVIEEKLNNNNMVCEIYDGCVLLFEHFRGFDRMIVYSYEGFDTSVLNIPVGTVCDVLCTRKRPPNPRLIDFLEKTGFSKYAVNEAACAEIEILPEFDKDSNLVVSDERHKEYAQQIFDLWGNCFNVNEISLPSLEKIKEDLCNNNFILYFGNDNEIAGSIQLGDSSGNTVFLQHICTNSKYRKKGIAEKMICSLHEIGKLRNFSKAMDYINENNFPSINLHKKLGFAFNGSLIEEYMKK